MNALQMARQERRLSRVANRMPTMRANGTIEQEVSEVRQALGDVKVNVLEIDWTSFLKMGVIAKLHIGRSRLKMQLTPEDLGLPPSAAKDMDAIFSLGDKLLMDKNLLAEAANAESRGRKLLSDPRKGVLQTPLGAFITVNAFSAVNAELTEIQKDYMAVPQRIVDNYDTLVAMMRDSYRNAGKVAYRRMKLEYQTNGLLALGDEDSFVTNFVENIVKHIPTAQEIAASFYWDLELSYAPTASTMAREAAEIEGIQLQVNMQLDQLRAEREAIEQKIRTEAERTRAEELRYRSAADQREMDLRAMNATVMDQTRKRLKAISDGMVDSIQTQIYNTALECAEDALAALIKNNQQAKGKGGAAQLQNVLETVRRLNIADDPTLNAFMTKMATELAASQGMIQKPQSLNDTLNAIITLTRQQLTQMGKPVREAKEELQLPPVITDEMARKARRTLDLPEITIDISKRAEKRFM